MVYLDGQAVADMVIDPQKHTFVGTFRSTQPPDPRGADIVPCPCGEDLWDTTTVFCHWQRGHFDVGQYRSLEGAAHVS